LWCDPLVLLWWSLVVTETITTSEDCIAINYCDASSGFCVTQIDWVCVS